MRALRSRFGRFCWLLLFSTALAGCGTRDYNKLVSSRVARARGEAKFRTLYAPTPLEGTPLKIRIPLAFKPDQLYAADSKHREDGDKIRPERFQPPFLTWPGFQYCYEGQAPTADGRKLPFYCYLGAQPGTAADAEKLAAKFQATLAETFKDAKAEWVGIDCDSPTGFAVQWKKLRIEADQPFLTADGQNKVTTENLPGIFEVWIAEKQNHIVVMAWRVPKAIDTPADAAAPPPNTVGGIILPPSGDLKPDMATMPVLMGGTLSGDEPTPGAAAGE